MMRGLNRNQFIAMCLVVILTILPIGNQNVYASKQVIKDEKDKEQIDQNLDTDKDKIPDWMELNFKTSVNKADTDEDGLNDYLEIYVIHTDATRKDSDNDGILDCNEDTDMDGLSNQKEIKIGSDPVKKDTDGDGIKDGKEVKNNNTSPVLFDTDEDGLTDQEEEILGLDSNNKYSDGKTLDSKRLILQVLDNKNISESLLNNDNVLKPSLAGKVSGDMNSKIYIEDTLFDALSNNKSVIGKPLDINFNGNEDLELSFDCSTLLKSHDLTYLKELQICSYEDNKFVPYKTEFLPDKNKLKANITKGGIYFVVKVDELLDELGFQSEKNTSSSVMKFDFKNPVETLSNSNNSNGQYVLLSDYQYVKLKGKVSPTNNIDTDGDGVSDYQELGTSKVQNLTSYIKYLLKANGVPEDSYAGKTTISVYSYNSLPVKADSDFDGIDDSIDSKPLDGTWNGTLNNSGLGVTSNISFTMDYRAFFNNNAVYNNKLSVTSSIYSAVVYDGITCKDNSTSTTYDMKELMELQGFSNVMDYNLSSAYSDDHVSEAYVGHRKVTYNGITKEVIGVIVRGTNGTLKEWSSNFDIGDTSDYYSYNDWIVKQNHKGFDIAATRIMKNVKNYISTYVDQSVQNVLWITGHSRGAGIANILGARFENSGYDTYTYTFAAPNTTTSINASSYDSIFNIINTDDFVPYLPMNAWGFTKYGKTASVSIADNYETDWESLTHISDYNPDTIGMENTIDELSDIATDRDNCYNYTCSCHGDSSNDTITITNYGTSKSSREEAIAKIPTNALPYCIITRYDGGWFYGWDFDVCQTPSYFMQILASVMAGTIDYYRFVVELNIADRYEDAKNGIVSSALGGIAHPHYQESYYLLANKMNTSNFN